MSPDQLYIGIDSGTQGTKAVIFSRKSGKIVAEAYAQHQIVENNTGLREQNPEWWIAACDTTITKMLSQNGIDRKNVRGIGVSGQQHGLVALDAENQVIRQAKLWCDTSTSPQCDEMIKQIGGNEKVISLIGNTIAAGFTASKLLWLKQNEPQNYDRIAAVLLPHDYINYWLTGEKKTECGDASGTAYFDVKTRNWSDEILSVLDPTGRLHDCLPEIIPSENPIGNIRQKIAGQFNISPDVLVSSGGGDNMMAAIGTGNVVPGIITASLGTSGTIYCYSDQPVVDPAGELAAFCSSSGGWLPLVCTMNVTVATELTRKLFGMSVPELNAAASKTSPGAEGIMLLPYFNGERTPAYPKATAVLSGITGTNYTRKNVARASMEGASLGLRYGLDVLKQKGIKPSEIRLVGGGARSPLWRRIITDIFNHPVVCPRSSEAGATGAALQAMWCYVNVKEGGTSLVELTDRYVKLDESTRIEPDNSYVSRYRDIYDRYMTLNKAMAPLFNQ